MSPTDRAAHLAKQTQLITLFELNPLTQTPPLCSGRNAATPCHNPLKTNALTRAKKELNYLIANPAPSRATWETLQDLSGCALCRECIQNQGLDRCQEWLNVMGAMDDGGQDERRV